MNPIISVAPMMDCTDRHYRQFMRKITQRALLYTEMIPCQMLIYGKRYDVLEFSPEEHPIALQLGGSVSSELAHCARVGEEMGYDEINLNVGCPSDRVQAGRFGACLMKEPDLVAECVNAMQQVVKIPVTVKTRIGVDDQDSYEQLYQFILKLKKAGCQSVIVHARKAWLKGLSPKENREIPPLRYEVVYQLKKDFPDMAIIINGGIKTIADMQAHLAHVDGVMIGREAYNNPYLFSNIDQHFYHTTDVSNMSSLNSLPARQKVIIDYLPYVIAQLEKGVPLRLLMRPMMGLFHGEPGAKKWRISLCNSDLENINSLISEW